MLNGVNIKGVFLCRKIDETRGLADCPGNSYFHVWFFYTVFNVNCSLYKVRWMEFATEKIKELSIFIFRQIFQNILRTPSGVYLGLILLYNLIGKCV